MVASKHPFPLGSRPQTPDSPPLPTVISSLRPYFVTSSSGTQDRPQPLSTQSLAHTFRHAWGGLPITPIYFRVSPRLQCRDVLFSSLLRATSSVSPLSAILTKNTGGVGYLQLPVARISQASPLTLHAGTPAIPFRSWVYFITCGHPGGGGLKQFPTTPRLLCKNRSAQFRDIGPGSPHLPRGVA